MNSLRILAIVPAYNEAESIANTVKEIQDKAPGVDVLVVNDGSSDCTMDVLRDMEINCLNLRRNLGIGGAVQSGYIYAKENGYDYTVQIDGDGQVSRMLILENSAKWLFQDQYAKTINSFLSISYPV